MRFSAAEALYRSGVDLQRLAVELPHVDPSRVPVWRASEWFRRLWPAEIVAMALPWGIYVAPAVAERPIEQLGPLIVHELAHLEQWRRLGPLSWARSYLGDYLRERWRGVGHREAYRAISLEIEAREYGRRFGGGP